MKKLFSKTVAGAVALACCLMSGYLKPIAYEASTTRIKITDEIIVEANIDAVFDEITIPEYESSSNSDSYVYKDLLDTNNETVYNTLVCLVDPKIESISINLPDTIVVDLGERESNSSLTDSEKEIIAEEVSKNVYPGYGYLLLDYPEIFWQAPEFQYGYSGYIVTNRINGTSTFEIKDVSMIFNLEESLFEDSSDTTSDSAKAVALQNAKEYKDKINNAVSNFEVSGETRYEKLKSIHDQIALSVKYVSGAGLAHSAAGALINGEAVCEGYAEAFKLICDRENIPNILVVSNNHMWNHVKMEDGNWYAIDLTWDDYDAKFGNNIEYVYDYFLKGSDEFYVTHFPVSTLYGIAYTFPELSTTNYEVQDTSDNSETTTTTTTTTTTVASTTTANSTTTVADTTTTNATTTTVADTTTTNATTTTVADTTTTNATTVADTTTTNATTTTVADTTTTNEITTTVADTTTTNANAKTTTVADTTTTNAKTTTVADTTTTNATTTTVADTTTTNAATTTIADTTTTNAATTTVADTTTTSVTTTVPKYDPADINHDGFVNIADVVICNMVVLSYNMDFDCDVNDDGVVNVFDLIILKRIITTQ